MKKEIGILLLLMLLACSQNSNHLKINESQINQALQKNTYNSHITKYFIEGEEVTKKIYDDQKSQLVEIEDTYHCAKTIGGGRNSYEAVDEQGIVWLIHCELNNNYTKLSISRK